MAYGFNDDKSKAQVLTAGEIKRKTITLELYDSTLAILPGETAEWTFNISNVLNLNSLIGITGIANGMYYKVLVRGIIPNFNTGRITVEFMNIGTSTVSLTGSVSLFVSYIDQ